MLAIVFLLISVICGKVFGGPGGHRLCGWPSAFLGASGTVDGLRLSWEPPAAFSSCLYSCRQAATHSHILLILLCAFAVQFCAFAIPAHSSEPEIFSNQFLEKISFHVVLLSVKICFPSAPSSVCSGSAGRRFFFCLWRFSFAYLLGRLVAL